ncbi:ATP-binding protein [Streptomyces neyagawaensis]|uniref:ATP-binding protein n=1 Tax=Streptomyces neyagawaensis TaxID=42238 RepID=UPI0006E45DEF|nr:ATP-binding protein [Streptomyces neyagawaensis]MCL6732732.1 ATP-binding protein [Streptomyces neyagawaensis]MDE1681498.1 ATP-binding protein [Streptomyces neyagawaensis]
MNGYIPPIVLGARPAQHRMCFTVGEHSAHHIRRIVRSYLDEWEMPELTDAVELGVTELLANVVRHVPDRRCALLLLRSPGGVRVEVTDGSEQLPVLRTDLSPYADGGRGLVLVDAVADKWGVGRWRDGKTVWFECRCGGEERSA